MKLLLLNAVGLILFFAVSPAFARMQIDAGSISNWHNGTFEETVLIVMDPAAECAKEVAQFIADAKAANIVVSSFTCETGSDNSGFHLTLKKR